MNDYILGISAYSHDSAAALLQGGRIVASAQQERFSRIRHDAAFPQQALDFCLAQAQISLDEVALVACAQAPGATEAQTLEAVRRDLAAAYPGRAVKLRACAHQRAHAASAFYPSPFHSAAVLCLDGGTAQAASLWQGRGEALTLAHAWPGPHSIGWLYSAITAFCGFKVNSGEYKLMGLAPYGQAVYADLMRSQLIELHADGAFTLNPDYFEAGHGHAFNSAAFARLLGGPARLPEGVLTQRECDLAASIQQLTQQLVCALARRAAAQTGERQLCLAGSVALNCAANGVLQRTGIFDAIWVQPAAGDAGTALGAALDAAAAAATPSSRAHLASGTDAMQGAFLGPAFSDADILAYLTQNGLPFTRHEGAALHDCVAARLASGAVVGWFQGRMEFGPRSLGARAILGDARDPAMQQTMNLKIKFRESFRPFAPCVLEADAADYFDLGQASSPYMLFVAPVSERIRLPPTASQAETGLGSLGARRSSLPAVTHVDFSARVQTVNEAVNPALFGLLTRFKQLTGCPVLVNTSFNVRGEPIVQTPQQAYACFMRTGMDVLVLGHCVLERQQQPVFAESGDWRARIALD